MRHQRTHIKKPYQCDVCNKKFTVNCDLVRHQRTHTGDKPYQCAVCNKKFTGKSNLVQHQITHTGEKTHFRDNPYQCAVCNRQFTCKSKLISHQIITQGISHINVLYVTKSLQERVILCITKELTLGRSHINVLYVTSSLQPYLSWKNSHGAKPYKCAVCNKKFTGKNSTK